MENDTWILIKIVVITILVTGVIIYLLSRSKHQSYVYYADNLGLSTYAKKKYVWADLKRIIFQNKYIAGNGQEDMNNGIIFKFKNGRAHIDRKSTIYNDVYKFAQNLQAPKSIRMVKGLFFIKQ